MGSSALDVNMAARFWFISFLVIAALGVVSAAKFCPRERKEGKECRAKDNQFKCGIFFRNLLGNNEIKWIGAVPDAIPTVRRKDPKLIATVFPKNNGKALDESYFLKWKKTCDSEEANDKCYLLFDNRKSDALDQCKATIGNLDGKDTIGNQLCDQAARFLRNDGQGGRAIQNVEIGFYSSTCGGPWTEVASEKAGALLATERLCCDANNKYVKCGGGSFRSTC